jgi:hypothetical protein
MQGRTLSREIMQPAVEDPWLGGIQCLKSTLAAASE